MDTLQHLGKENIEKNGKQINALLAYLTLNINILVVISYPK